MKKTIGTILKEMRENAGFTPKQVYEELDIKQSRFSAWECDKSEPPTEILLQLCEFYGVNDVLSAFGYNGYNDDGTLSLNLNECNLIEDYRKLNPSIQKALNKLVNVMALSNKESLEEFRSNKETKGNSKVQKKKSLMQQYEEYEEEDLLAAHGSEGMNKEELELLKEEAERGNEELRKLKAKSND